MDGEAVDAILGVKLFLQRLEDPAAHAGCILQLEISLSIQPFGLHLCDGVALAGLEQQHVCWEGHVVVHYDNHPYLQLLPPERTHLPVQRGQFHFS